MEETQQSEVSTINVIYAGSERKKSFFTELKNAITQWNDSVGRVGKRKVCINATSLFDELSDGLGSKMTKYQSSHVIIHKLTDEMAYCKQYGASEPNWSRLLALFGALQYTHIHLDHLSGICCLLDRVKMTEIIDKSVAAIRKDERLRIRSPNWHLVSALDDKKTITNNLNGLKYPIIFKRRTASGIANSHDMVIAYDSISAVVALNSISSESFQEDFKFQSVGSDCQQNNMFNEGLDKKRTCSQSSGIIDVESSSTFNAKRQQYITGDIEGTFLGARHSTNEFIAQEYVCDHGGILFKVYVIGENIDVQVRSSVTHGHDKCSHGFFYFNSQKVGCKNSVDVQFDAETGLGANTDARRPSKDLVKSIVNGIKKELDLTMFGIDMVYDVKEDCFVVIDINYMPGYKGVVKAHAWMVDLIVTRVQESGLLEEQN